MTDTNPERILGSLRIFQAIHNDLELKHEIVTLEDGTKTWAYTYEGIDPYELEDKAFPTILKAFSQHEQEVVQKFVNEFQTVAITETNDYANGWNRCRKWVRANLNKLAGLEYSEEYSNIPYEDETKSNISPTQEKRQRNE